jgi:SHS2 domain-containing protein
MAGIGSGHRRVPHTADVRIEAWAPTRDGCVRHAVLGAVESFLDTSSAHPDHTRTCRVGANRDEDVLVGVLEEVIYLLDTTGEAPADLELHSADGAVDVTLSMVDARTVPQVGAVPKAVSLNDLRLSRGQRGWGCSVTLDV